MSFTVCWSPSSHPNKHTESIFPAPHYENLSDIEEDDGRSKDAKGEEDIEMEGGEKEEWLWFGNLDEEPQVYISCEQNLLNAFPSKYLI